MMQSRNPSAVWKRGSAKWHRVRPVVIRAACSATCSATDHGRLRWERTSSLREVARYILRLEPLASAKRQRVVTHIAPTIQRCPSSRKARCQPGQ